MINLEKRHLEFVQSTLKKYIPNDTIWLFGSRVTEKIKPYSDIDLAIIANQEIPSKIMSQLSLAFAESDLPYKVDLIDWSMIDDEFKAIVRAKYEIIQQGKLHRSKLE